MDIILASASVRRIELLRQSDIDFLAVSADIKEEIFPGEKPDDLVKRLAREKADQIATRYPNKIVLGADTIVYFDGQIIGKPDSIAHAREILRRLNGNTHVVYTGVCLLRSTPKDDICWVTRTSVTFHTLSSQIIEQLLSSGNPLDKAGGYAIQEHEELLISSYQGLRSNVIGLPIEEVLERLRDFS